MELILAILVAVGQVVSVDALVGSAIPLCGGFANGGIVGNRVDAAFMALCEGISIYY